MKRYFTKCFACYLKFGNCKKQRLPRKKKKRYKDFLITTSKFRESDFATEFGISCYLSTDYVRDKKLFFLLPLLKKYHKSVSKLTEHCNDIGETIYINTEGRLSWYWEDDNGLYSYSGIMPFCYNKEDADETWAFSEVSNMIESILDYPDNFEFPKEIVSDKTLLQFITKTI